MDEDKDFKFNELFDGFINGARQVTETLVKKGSEFAVESGLKDLKDYYSFYSWPPLNLYSSIDNSLIFEFGLSGFVKDDIKIEFEDEYMIFSAILSNKYSTGDWVKSYKKGLKLKDIKEQKYYVPSDKYCRKNYTMHMKNGLLRVVFPPAEE